MEHAERARLRKMRREEQEANIARKKAASGKISMNDVEEDEEKDEKEAKSEEEVDDEDDWDEDDDVSESEADHDSREGSSDSES